MDPEESSSAASPSRPKLPQQRGGNQKTPKRNQPHQAFRGNLPTPAAQQDESQHLSEGKERDMACSSASHGSPSSGPGARQANQGEAATPPTLPPGLKPLWSAVHLPHPRLVPIPPITPYDLTGAYEADDTAPISAIPAAHHTPRSPQASDAGKGKQKETHVNAWATDSDNDSVPDEELEDELRKIGTELMKSYNEGNITKEELNAQLRKKLGAPVISRAHARQYDRLFIEKDKARPEQLPIVRNGPGTDMTSQMYQELARPRLAVGVEEPEKWSIQPPMTIPNAGYEEIDPDENWRTVRKGTHTYHAQWTAYFKSPPVWPVIKEDGKLTLHSKRPKGFIYEEQPFPHCAIFSDNSELAEVNRGPYSCDWWFGVNLPNDKVGILTHFYLWLNCLPEVNHYVNIYHKSFFDGTAVPDGAFGMFIPNAKHLPTPRDMQRKRTALHWHETAAGYMHNKILFLREERRAEIARQEEFRRAREAFLSQPVPKAVPSNVYLRPVEFHDAPGLHRLMNWYMQNSALSSETDPIDEVDARQMVEDCRSNHLPFIVAVERATKTNNNAAEKVLGYAYLSYYMDGKSSNRYTLEMRVYVDHTHKRTHIGRSLVDRILAMCDVMHRATAAHVFEANNHNVSPEGQRYANVVCAIAYPPNRASRYGWVKDWLTREFRFRELGTLHGGRVKFGEAYVLHTFFSSFAFLLELLY